MPQLINLIGQRFGCLVVTAKGPNHVSKGGQRSVRWICECDCGGTALASTYRLRIGLHVSCGCKNMQIRDAFGNWGKRDRRGRTPQRILFERYSTGASDRNLAFGLSLEQFISITSQPCHYCGDAPSKVIKTAQSGSYTYNGVDRIDNSIGYEFGNCVPCCLTCNRMKSKDSALAFVLHCLKVVANQYGRALRGLVCRIPPFLFPEASRVIPLQEKEAAEIREIAEMSEFTLNDFDSQVYTGRVN